VAYYETSSNSTATIWCEWTSGTSSSNATCGTEIHWLQWTSETAATSNCRPRERTAAEIERDRLAAERREQERKEREKQQRAAVARSTELLREWLDEKERQRFDREKKFHVVAQSGRRYEIDVSKRQHNVFELDAKGKRIVEHCILANAFDLPLADNALAQKLLLEADEDQFRRIANQTRLAA
jgi:hypothetical protein